MERAGGRLAGVTGVSLLLLAIAVWSFRSRTEVAAAPAGLPSAVEMDSLARYLAPAEPAPSLDDYAVFIPARPEPRDYDPPPQASVEEPGAVWRLSAILIAGARPVAIINDEAVAPGAELSDGSRVLTIERDHVVIRAPNGARRRLFLTAG